MIKYGDWRVVTTFCCLVGLMFGGSGALAVVDLVGSGGRPSLAPAAAASAALQLQAVQWTGEEGELQDK